MSTEFLSAIALRRTNYALTAKSSIPDAKLEEIIKQLVLNTPSAFNSQSGRVSIVLGEQNKKLWALVREAAVAGLEGEQKDGVNKRIDGLSGGYGSILFWEDQAVVEGFAAKVPPYASQFPHWSDNSTGMLQHGVWVALALEGLGASLQHNGADPALAAKIQAAFGLPTTWRSTAIMPFGVVAAPPSEKSFSPIEPRVQVFN